MSLLNSRIVSLCTKVTLFLFVSIVHIGVRAWEIDFSRRSKDLEPFRTVSPRGPSSVVSEDVPVHQKSSNFRRDQAGQFNPNDESWLSQVISSLEPSQDIVIMNTADGFVPAKISVRKGKTYRFHIVNVNEKEKNTSFVLDSFSENHAVYFGSRKSFTLNPKVDGVYSFTCPETAAQGQLVVIPDTQVKTRRMASE